MAGDREIPKHERWNESPIIIGGVGGSGTRTVCEILLRSGYFMGDDLNESLDTLTFMEVINNDANDILRSTASLDYDLSDIPQLLRLKVRKNFNALLNDFIGTIPNTSALWGWKQPRMIFLLPFIDDALPTFRFIHVIRDGRDMAFSENRSQVTRHYEALFGQPPADIVVDSVRWWSKVNLEVKAWAERELSNRYFCLRFEDLCEAPIEALASLSDFTSAAMPQDAVAHIRTPPTFGRWKGASEDIGDKMMSCGRAGLTEFGYVQSTTRGRKAVSPSQDAEST